MNKKIIVTIIVIIVIVASAIVVGIQLAKKQETKPTSNPTVDTTATPIQTPTETTTPVIETATPEPEETPTPVQSVDVSKMSSTEKEEYAKKIAQKTWEALGVQKQIYYSYDEIDKNGNYIITVRDEATTNELVRYKINIKTGSCEITY